MKMYPVFLCLFALALSACSPETPSTEDPSPTSTASANDNSSAGAVEASDQSAASESVTVSESQERYPYEGPINVTDLMEFQTRQKAPVLKYLYLYYRPDLVESREIAELFACASDAEYLAMSQNEFEFEDYLGEKQTELAARVDAVANMMRSNPDIMPEEGVFRFSVPFKLVLGEYDFQAQFFNIDSVNWQRVGFYEPPTSDCVTRGGSVLVKMPETLPGGIEVELLAPTGLERVPMPEEQAREFLKSRTNGSRVNRDVYLHVTFDLDFRQDNLGTFSDPSGIGFVFTPRVVSVEVKKSQFDRSGSLATLDPGIFVD